MVQCIRLWVCWLTWDSSLLTLFAIIVTVVIIQTEMDGLNWCFWSLLVNRIFWICFSEVLSVTGLLGDGLWDDRAQVQTHSGAYLVILSAGFARLAHQNEPFIHLPHVLSIGVRVQRALTGTVRTQRVTWVNTDFVKWNGNDANWRRKLTGIIYGVCFSHSPQSCSEAGLLCSSSTSWAPSVPSYKATLNQYQWLPISILLFLLPL